MDTTRKHFRFPIYSDTHGVKEVEKQDQESNKVIEKHHEAAVLNRSRPFMERSTIPQKREKKITQPIEMDPVASYDEPSRTTDEVAKINQQAKKLKVKKQRETESFDNKNDKVHDTDKETSEVVNHTHSEMVEEYMSFANNSFNQQTEELEDDSIPAIKQRIRQSREMREEEVPFRRKQRNKQQK